MTVDRSLIGPYKALIRQVVAKMPARFDSHDVTNFINDHHNSALDHIVRLYAGTNADPVHRATQEVAKQIARVDGIQKDGAGPSERRIRISSWPTARDGVCVVTRWRKRT